MWGLEGVEEVGVELVGVDVEAVGAGLGLERGVRTVALACGACEGLAGLGVGWVCLALQQLEHRLLFSVGLREHRCRCLRNDLGFG